MPRKTWNVHHKGYNIKVMNSWSWSGNMSGELYINDTLIDKKEEQFSDIGLKKSLGETQEIYYEGMKITLKVGNAWHLCGIACAIYIDDIKVGGDRIVLFTN